MGVPNDWTVEHHANSGATRYWRTIDGTLVEFWLTQRDVMRAGSIPAVQRLLATMANDALKKYEQDRRERR